MPEDRVNCRICDWSGDLQDVLVSLNPFDAGEIINGCPKCKSVNSFATTDDSPFGTVFLPKI